jgi:hypothetical protein
MLVPQLTSGASGDLDGLRAQCNAALDVVGRANPERIVVVGAGPQRRSFAGGATGNFRGFGVEVDVALPGAALSEDGGDALPLSLGIAALLMSGRTWQATVTAETVPRDQPASDAVQLGRQLSAVAGRVAILAMGDGSAALGATSPGYVVADAEAWQKSVSEALGHADVDWLLALTPDDGQRFVAAGLPAWQVLCGAAQDQRWDAELLADEAPRGVAYVVATWQQPNK